MVFFGSHDIQKISSLLGIQKQEPGTWLGWWCSFTLYPLVMTNIAIENGHWNSGFTWIYPLKMVIFHSYVSLPEGRWSKLWLHHPWFLGVKSWSCFAHFDHCFSLVISFYADDLIYPLGIQRFPKLEKAPFLKQQVNHHVYHLYETW